MKWYDKVDSLDRRIPYVLLLIFILVPLIKPMGLPIPIGQEVKDAYSAVDSLKEGQIVILSPSYSPGADSECLPQHMAMAKHLMSKKVKIVAVHLAVDGVMYSERVLKGLAPGYNYQYGSDYVILPFTAGDQGAVAAMGRDFAGLYKQDIYGTPTTSLALMQRIKSIKDFSLVIDFMPGNSLMWYIMQLNANYGITCTGGVTAVCIPNMMPYVSSGQSKGLLGGLGGAAQYEQLLKDPARASAGMDAQSLAHVLVLFFIVLGNIATVSRRRDQASKRR